ncbi:hypothetical protein BS614_11785 [Paenibacillus xylanexedens]|uniref:hypothetical protein n=1 Tax=Paenibacillus xylanexedens TaxID=528191 RepID=UPI0009380C3A|nr:hypothetical protein [Paenibacillus xylanexedens]APO44611.1 hypothetical protein BS614_11785 [Paenibacillus xylanexedens]
MKKMIIVTLVLSLVSASLAFAATDASQKISIVLNGKELKTRAGTEVQIIDNHVYIPASVLRDARFAVEYKNSKLNLINSYFRYTRNLMEMHVMNQVFTTRFNKIDQEIVNILGKVMLEDPVDSSNLQEYMEEARSNAVIRPEVFTPVQDYNSFDFGSARQSVEEYQKAIQELMAYVGTKDKKKLKSFYEKRKQALEFYNSYTNTYDLIFKASFSSAVK